jgi:hypothetical protein
VVSELYLSLEWVWRRCSKQNPAAKHLSGLDPADGASSPTFSHAIPTDRARADRAGRWRTLTRANPSCRHGSSSAACACGMRERARTASGARRAGARGRRRAGPAVLLVGGIGGAGGGSGGPARR